MNIFIYREREINRKSWGENTDSKTMLLHRNMTIYQKYRSGISVNELSEMFYLSPKSIQKIIAKLKSDYK